MPLTACLQMPGPEIVRSIYHQMINGHLQSFDPDVAKISGKLTDATIDLHKTVMNNFLPSSVKFHYQFNLREMSNITQVRLPQLILCLHMHTPVYLLRAALRSQVILIYTHTILHCHRRSVIWACAFSH
jgi:hypothetical protein